MNLKMRVMMTFKTHFQHLRAYHLHGMTGKYFFYFIFVFIVVVVVHAIKECSNNLHDVVSAAYVNELMTERLT